MVDGRGREDERGKEGRYGGDEKKERRVEGGKVEGEEKREGERERMGGKIKEGVDGRKTRG